MKSAKVQKWMIDKMCRCTVCDRSLGSVCEGVQWSPFWQWWLLLYIIHHLLVVEDFHLCVPHWPRWAGSGGDYADRYAKFSKIDSLCLRLWTHQSQSSKEMYIRDRQQGRFLRLFHSWSSWVNSTARILTDTSHHTHSQRNQDGTPRPNTHPRNSSRATICQWNSPVLVFPLLSMPNSELGLL